MKEYKSIFKCFFKFFSIYFAFTALYYLFLRYYTHQHICDPFTKIVAEQSSWFYNLFAHDSLSSIIVQAPKEIYVRFYIGKKYISIINEGCNSFSIIILYISFIITFYSKFKNTFLFLVFSIPIIYLCNILRIVFLNYIFYFHPVWGKNFHDYIFPSIIYGIIISFWFLWIKFFILKK